MFSLKALIKPTQAFALVTGLTSCGTFDSVKEVHAVSTGHVSQHLHQPKIVYAPIKKQDDILEPAWKAFKWQGYNDLVSFSTGRSCTMIPFPPGGWLPDCNLAQTESGDFLIFNALRHDREAFGFAPEPHPKTKIDTNYLAFRG